MIIKTVLFFILLLSYEEYFNITNHLCLNEASDIGVHQFTGHLNHVIYALSMRWNLYFEWLNLILYHVTCIQDHLINSSDLKMAEIHVFLNNLFSSNLCYGTLREGWRLIPLSWVRFIYIGYSQALHMFLNKSV